MARQIHSFLKIERNSGDPLYRQVRRGLEYCIAIGILDPSAPLPSSRELALDLGLSRNTITTAYQELVAQGFLIARPRRGLYLNEEICAATSPKFPLGSAEAKVNWSSRLRDLPDATLPEIEKVPNWYQYPYPFVAGQPDSASFPRLIWSRALRAALSGPNLHYSLRDGISAEDPLLVEMLCKYVLPARGIEVDESQVLVTLGSQEGLQLVSDALLWPGSVVAVEDPGYLDARHIFMRAGAALHPLPVDSAGLIPPDSLAGTSIAYVTPSHHHPTNVTLSISRRRKLLSLAEEGDALVIEDDYDSELRYRGSPSPALKALDHNDRVIYVGTFSKFLAPGLRLGYVVAGAELIEYLRTLRRYSIRHPPGQLQRAMALLIQTGQYHQVLRRYRKSLKRKWETMRESLDRHVPWPTPAPPGGVSIWVSGPPELDCVRLAADAQEEGIILERGDIFFIDSESHRNHFRLGFAAVDLAAIDSGIALLGDVIRRELG